MSRLDALEPPPRVVDASLLVAVAVILTTGLVSLVSGRPTSAWVFDLHAVAGLSTVVLLGWKLRRVRHRITPGRLTGTRVVSVLLTTVALGALATGVWWVFGGHLDVGPWGLLNLHIGLGLLVPVLLVVHLRSRFSLPSRSSVDGRRTALRYAAILGAGAAAWRLQSSVNEALETAGADRRFTGSRERGSDAGNRFPVTSWVADDPDPVDVDAWSLAVTGAVDDPQALGYDELPTDGSERAVLDCTSGWYSAHDWQGVPVGALLDRVGPAAEASWVQFESVTGYRWSLPVDEARDALLATHVDGERLGHGHGAPLRLVAPGRRGFQWVKWVERVHVTRRRELGEWVAIFASGFDE